jgi:hypothetical protein
MGSRWISRQLGEQQSAYFSAHASHWTSSMLQVASWQLPMRSLLVPHCMHVLTTSSVMRSASRSSNTKFWPEVCTASSPSALSLPRVIDDAAVQLARRS